MIALTYGVFSSDVRIQSALSTPQLFLDRPSAIKQLLSGFVLPRITDMGGVAPIADAILALPGLVGVVVDDDQYESPEEWLCSLSHDDLEAWALAQPDEVKEGICKALFDFEDGDDCEAFFSIEEVFISAPKTSTVAIVRVDFDEDASSVEIRDGVHAGVDIAVEQGFLTAGYDGPAYSSHWTYPA